MKPSTPTTLFYLLSVLPFAFADDNSTNAASNCSCFRINNTDSSSSATNYTYFTHYAFLNWESLQSQKPPVRVTDAQDNGTSARVTSEFFSQSPFADQWGLANWTQAPDKDNPDVSTVELVNSPQNVFIARDSDDGPSFLTLRTVRNEDFQSSAELDSSIEMMHGSIRMYGRVSGAPGAVAGFFFYKDDTNESDIEILTKDPPNEYHASNQPTVDSDGNEIPGASSNVTIAVPASGYPTSTSPTRLVRRQDEDFSTASPATESTEPNASGYPSFNAYRLDWLPGITLWSANGAASISKTQSVPGVPCTPMINMWGNGGAWSGDMEVGDEARFDIRWVEMVWNATGKDDGCAAGRRVCDVDGRGGGGSVVDAGTVPGGDESAGSRMVSRSYVWLLAGIMGVVVVLL